MNLLANQLSLSGVEFKNNKNGEALQRLIDTQQAYQQNSIVKNNFAVMKYVNQSLNQSIQTNSAQIISPIIFQNFIKFIELNPTNYIGYYNLFNLYIKQKKLKQALPHLIEAISALDLQRALKQKSQKLVNKVLKEYCSDSVLVYLIKSIIHIRNQKYIIAVSDLFWVVQKINKIQDKIFVLELIKQIFKALGQKQKYESTENQINQLNKSNEHLKAVPIESQIKLVCVIQLPTLQQDIKSQLSKRLKQFSELVKFRQVNSLKSSTNNPQILFKQINSKDLTRSSLTKLSLFQQIKTSIQQSPLYTKSQSKKLIRGKQSLQLIINESQQLAHNQTDKLLTSFTSRQHLNQSQDQRSSMTIQTAKKSDFDNSMDQSDSKKLNNSLNSSGLRGKKKTQNIYPLEKPNQFVQIKLVMAQLTNNKQLVGNMDPYCVISYNGKKKQSTVIKAGGLQPRWKQSFMFNLSDKPSQVMIEVFDKQNFFKKDDFVGVGKLLVQKNGFTKIQIFEGLKQAGTVFISIEAKS